jgi:hypothetical protein
MPGEWAWPTIAADVDDRSDDLGRFGAAQRRFDIRARAVFVAAFAR